jgi:hypothetical protein
VTDDDPADPERAQWERARRVLQDREDAERARAAQAQAVAAPPENTSRRGLFVGLSIALAVALGVAVVIAVIRHGSSSEPAWVRQLGLATPSSVSGAAPDRFGSGGTGAPSGGSSTTSPDLGTIDDTGAQRPQIDTTGEDFDQIWRQIEVLEDWLLLHPDPAPAREIYVPGTDPYRQLVALLSQLRRDHHTLDVQGYRIVGVQVQARPAGDRVVLHYADTYRDRVERDQHGQVVSSAPYDGRARLWSLTLVRGRDNRWRVQATSFLGYGAVVPAG